MHATKNEGWELYIQGCYCVIVFVAIAMQSQRAKMRTRKSTFKVVDDVVVVAMQLQRAKIRTGNSTFKVVVVVVVSLLLSLLLCNRREQK